MSEKYDDALVELEKSIAEVESVVGKNTNFHLFLYQRMASIHMLQLNFEKVEHRFKQCIEVAESGKKSLNKNKDQT